MTYKLGIIGGGNMGLAIARGSLTARVLNPADLIVADLDAGRREEIARLGCTVTDDPCAVTESEQFILAVDTVLVGVLVGAAADQVVVALRQGRQVRLELAGVALAGHRRAHGAEDLALQQG